ncbi:hypothetical protein [Neobacillus soli]|uniref:hypothetical protein n=1 Tax=Neobacillus soli TaxID=220688 RepID=UPI0008264FE8|nr:hypothetical protein [Neobacillus soli]
MKITRILIFILIAFLLFWFIYFLKTGDLFFKDGYFTKERAYQAWLSDNREPELTRELLENVKKIEPADNRLLYLADENKIYQLRFRKEFFLWTSPSVYRIDNETIKKMNENDMEYHFYYNCVATVITKTPDISKVKIGKNKAEVLPLAPYLKDAKDLKLWYFNLEPDASDCQGPSGQTFTFYDNSGKVIKKIADK